MKFLKKAKAKAKAKDEVKVEPKIKELTETEAAELANHLLRTCLSGHTHDTCTGSVFCDYMSGHLPL